MSICAVCSTNFNLHFSRIFQSTLKIVEKERKRERDFEVILISLFQTPVFCARNDISPSHVWPAVVLSNPLHSKDTEREKKKSVRGRGFEYEKLTVTFMCRTVDEFRLTMNLRWICRWN